MLHVQHPSGMPENGCRQAAWAPVFHAPSHPLRSCPAGRQYLRIAADLHMALAHPAVVLHLLGGPQAALFSGAFLQVFRLVQGASPYRWAPARGGGCRAARRA